MTSACSTRYWGRFDEAMRLYVDALDSTISACGEVCLDAASLYHNIGGLLHSRGEFAAAAEPARRAWAISRRLLGDADPRTMADAAAYAAVLDGLERYDESEAIYRRALVIFEQAYGREHDEVAVTLHNLAAVLSARGRRKEAVRCYRRSLAIKIRLSGGDTPDIALTRNNLGRLLAEMDQPEEAVTLLSKAVAVLERRLDPTHPHIAAACRNLRAAEALTGPALRIQRQARGHRPSTRDKRRRP